MLLRALFVCVPLLVPVKGFAGPLSVELVRCDLSRTVEVPLVVLGVHCLVLEPWQWFLLRYPLLGFVVRRLAS